MFDDQQKFLKALGSLKALDISPGDIFHHYKGGRYTIVTTSLMEDTLERLVTYRDPKGYTWTRTVTNFLEEVTATIPRFRKEN